MDLLWKESSAFCWKGIYSTVPLLADSKIQPRYVLPFNPGGISGSAAHHTYWEKMRHGLRILSSIRGMQVDGRWVWQHYSRLLRLLMPPVLLKPKIFLE
jgi:hypothetical protein